mmetsp:Transcript_49782/g.160954  ORF Transcript_49782/g.160954 Transcript_49782/m.160954 type:complete len:296 (+) Transcript_49782:499-1386(+)
MQRPPAAAEQHLQIWQQPWRRLRQRLRHLIQRSSVAAGHLKSRHLSADALGRHRRGSGFGFCCSCDSGRGRLADLGRLDRGLQCRRLDLDHGRHRYLGHRGRRRLCGPPARVLPAPGPLTLICGRRHGGPLGRRHGPLGRRPCRRFDHHLGRLFPAGRHGRRDRLLAPPAGRHLCQLSRLGPRVRLFHLRLARDPAHGRGPGRRCPGPERTRTPAPATHGHRCGARRRRWMRWRTPRRRRRRRRRQRLLRRRPEDRLAKWRARARPGPGTYRRGSCCCRHHRRRSRRRRLVAGTG